MPVVEPTEAGLYCAAGRFHIDPRSPVERAVITHAHFDHARPGCGSYITAEPGASLLAERLGPDAPIQAVPYGRTILTGDVALSFHPAGHILGSAQLRIAHQGEIWAVSGDYKRQPDPTCAAFQPVKCDVFVSESTYGLPVYRWQPPEDVFAEIHEWWRSNQAAGRTSVLFVHALGKAQRVLAGLDASLGPIQVHGAIARYLPAYEAAGAKFPRLTEQVRGCGMVLAPPSARRSPWLRRFGALSTATASGWMQIRGLRRREGVDRGFALSDHADWEGLLATIAESRAKTICLTHRYAAVLARWLRDQGKDARVLT
jgi:putative mRNA 3-end processing factor